MAGHDIIVVGASVGGVEATKSLLSQMPRDLDAAIFVVVHRAAAPPSILEKILDRAGPLEARAVQDREEIRHRRVYVAPADHHLLVREGHVRVVRGPKENRWRPAIDPLFRSAAATYSSRVIGIVLTGMLDDGSVGLLTIKRCGGIAIVQDPEDALAPDMLLHALKNVDVDFQLPIAKMGATLTKLVYETSAEAPEIPPYVKTEVNITTGAVNDITDYGEDFGARSPFSCPDCGGPLWELQVDRIRRYRCLIGHAFTTRSLLEDQNEMLEQSLWSTVRAMEERAHVLEILANDERAMGNEEQAGIYDAQAADSRRHARLIRDRLLRGEED
jgi:two-component system chemotaxis response regulator CheB